MKSTTKKASPAMPVWELINPSDAYTFEAPSIEIAAVIAMLLGNGYGAKRIDVSIDDDRTPLFSGWPDWCHEHGIDEHFFDNHLPEIAAAFESFLIGSYAERLDYVKVLKAVPKNKRAAVIAERQERRRTSMNRIGEVAEFGARVYRELANKALLAQGGDRG